MPLEAEHAKFLLVTKRILQTRVSSNPATLIRHKNEIIKAYSVFIKYCDLLYEKNLSQQQKDTVVDALNTVSAKFEECLIKLNCKFTLSANLLTIPDPSQIKIIGIETEETEGNTSTHEADSLNATFRNKTIEEEQKDEASETEETSFLEATEFPTMTELTSSSFLKMASSHLNKVYSGDPLALPSFMDSVKLLESLATTTVLKTLLATFVKTKIDGRARDFISDSDTTVELILNKLSQNIKPDNSKVVTGRMLSLRMNNTNPADFAEKVENLADALRRSLIIEGMTHIKATEIAIDKTIELCRANAKTDLVKSVLEATTYTSSKDVVAKLLIQTDKAKQEHQILSFKKTNQNQTSHKKPQNQRPNNGNNFNNFNNSNRNNNRFNNHSSRPNNYYQNGNNYHQKNNRQRSYSNGTHSNNRQNNYTERQNNVRVFSNSGNGESPVQSHRMGAPIPQSSQYQNETF